MTTALNSLLLREIKRNGAVMLSCYDCTKVKIAKTNHQLACFIAAHAGHRVDGTCTGCRCCTPRGCHHDENIRKYG